jgi:hypothetical protein
VFRLGYVHGSVAAYESTVDISGGDDDYIVVGFSASVSGAVRFFANGKFLQQIATGGINNNASNLHIGQDVFASYASANFDLPFCAYFGNQFLSDQQHLSYAQNPWQLFAPERRVSYYLPASGIPTLSAATAVSITSTTATPRVTVTF